MSSRSFLIVLVFVLAAGFAAGAWWLVKTPPAVAPKEGPTPPAPVQPTREPAPPEPDRTHLEVDPVAQAEAATTVVFPLEVELELVESAVVPKGPGVAAMGSDATAKLAGSLNGAGGQGLAAEIRFVAGANEGRVLRSGRDGRFGANDLYPGLSIVKIEALGTPGAMREVLLRKDRESLLNIGFGRPGYFQGVVKDAAGAPVPGAKVTVDGQETQTDDQGEFVFPTVAGGDTFAIAEKAGYAATWQKLTIVAASTVEKGAVTFVLRKPARLEITIEERLNVEGQALVFLLPDPLGSVREFPWYRVNPTRLYPGGTVTVEDLPPTRVSVRLFHAGAVAKPLTRSVTLVEGATEHLPLHLEPAPVLNGIVTQDGSPAANAEVVLEAPERSGAMLSVLGESNYLQLEREILTDFPPAVQRVKANAAGEFVLSSCESVTPVRYLHATSADGRNTAWKILKGGETRVDLALEPASGEGRIVVEMEGRTQGLPVRVTVNGTPREASVLAPDADLKIGGLALGDWKLSARWNGEPIVTSMPVQLRDETVVEIVLPQGAIVGQDEETRKRSGK
jgi:hypothetical protein